MAGEADKREWRGTREAGWQVPALPSSKSVGCSSYASQAMLHLLTVQVIARREPCTMCHATHPTPLPISRHASRSSVLLPPPGGPVTMW